MQFVYESLILVALGIWVAYCALPEPARKPVVMPANSTIYRWNEIASALGHTGTQVAVQQPANSFFLTDVEKVVDKVLTREPEGQRVGSRRAQEIRHQGCRTAQKGHGDCRGLCYMQEPRHSVASAELDLTRLRPARSRQSVRGCRGR